MKLSSSSMHAPGRKNRRKLIPRISPSPSFAIIHKGFGFEAATHFQLILQVAASSRLSLSTGGSLIPIVVIGMRMALPQINTYFAASYGVLRRMKYLD